MTIESGDRDHVGCRYMRWIYDVEPRLTADQSVHGNEVFAMEFASLPAHQEPYEGWGETMAYLCRRIARQYRGEPVGEWVPEWNHPRHARDRELANLGAEVVRRDGGSRIGECVATTS